jgi:serpin B
VAAGAAIALAACSGGSTGTEIRSDAPRAPVDRSTTAATVLANSDLATDLYGQLARHDQNFVFSPYAVSLALAEVASGAAGVTELQLAATQHQHRDLDLRSGLNTLAQQIATRDGDQQNDVRQGQVSIEIPVALWGQLDTRVETPFLTDLARWFGTGIRLVDFRSDPDAARQSIDDWTSDQTSDQFDDIVGPGQISEATRLVMTAATFITAPWDERFDATRTRQTTFHLLDGQTDVATTMSITSPQGLLYAKGDHWVAVMLPYLGRQLAMVLIVPDQGSFDRVQSGLDGTGFQTLLGQLRPTPLALEMPRFQVSTTAGLEGPLSAEGAPSLFDPNRAQLPGITADEPLWVSRFDEQAFISADEEGTQASAPTAIRTPPPTPPTTIPVVIDRPFMVAVVDRASGEPLLFGRVVDPVS